MSSENYNIDLDKQFIEKLYGLDDMPAPPDISLDELKNVLEKIQTKINGLLMNTSSIAPATTQSSLKPASAQPVAASSSSTPVDRPKTIMVVDDLGIVTYQLKILFQKLGFEVTVSQEINDAIEKFKVKDFGYVVIDLFIPTEREGFILLDEIKKLSLLCQLNTKIIVMTASSKPEYKTNCKNHGADAFVEKAPGWQEELIKHCSTD